MGPSEVPKHVKCIAVLHNMCREDGRINKISARCAIETYMHRFPMRSTPDHELRTLLHKRLIDEVGDEYRLDPGSVSRFLAPYMQQVAA